MDKNQLREKMQHHLDNLTKPVGSLGDLEDFAMKMSLIQGAVPPVLNKKAVYVFASDHGINAEGVSMYPQEVTYQMLINVTAGGAGISVLAKNCGYDVVAVDTGILTPVDDSSIIDCRAGSGSANFHETEAMTAEQASLCLENGRRLAQQAADAGYQLVAIGDLGISNTTTAAAMAIAGGLEADLIIDKGTGISDEMLDNKRRVIIESVEKHAPYKDAEDIIRKVGGFEQAVMAGFILGLKGRGIACVIDGFPVTAGALMAWLIDNSVSEYLFAGHKSKVRGHRVMLDKLGLSPIVDFNMRLGEGTGAVIGGYMVELGVKTACEMASFENANVSKSLTEEENY